jgi:hypothetical protein
VDRVPAEDIFEEEKRPETTQAVEEPEEHRRRGLVLYVVSLLFVIIAGLYLLTRQSSSGVWNEETWDYLLKKNEQRVLHLRPYQTYRIDAEGENVVQLEPHKFNPKDEGERQVFLLVRAIGPGRARVDLVPSGQVLRFVVQGMIRPMEEDEAIAKLDQDQRLQMGRLLLRSGQKRPREEVANALADYSRAELILRPVKSRDLPLYNDVRRLQKETDQTIRREVENLKVQYYNSKKGDREVANAFLEKILELIPDKGDPQHQVVRLILDYRRANEK